ncbi:iron complex transport system substrate-binding protein [Rhizobium subbaraonis]|uniref:Iron complex transport system substrate-binding protein n=2 Tax=Rhizobium subbaraonis TaxID=908946 RepID=A0A285V0Z0_9HYPH|nr:iron complex transport system substrate-binding protein [Rhizobium subbaraonis]
MSKASALLSMALAASAAFFCSAPAGAAQETQYPLSIQNCGRTLTFDKAPSRAVADGQNSAEVFYLLGLGDKVVGSALWIGPVLEGYEDVDARVPRIAELDPSFEGILATKPDFVATQFQWQIGPEGVVATVEQFEELGIPVYTAPADCHLKDKKADGAAPPKFTMDLVYQEIEEVARIFNVSARGEKVISELKAREQAAKARITALRGNVSAVFWYSSAKLNADPYVAGEGGVPAYLMSELGIQNVVESNEEWPTVGWETIAKANPTLIVAGDMTRRRFEGDDLAVKLVFLKNDPVASVMDAAREGRIVEMKVQFMDPTVRTIRGLEILADGLERLNLVQ